MLNFTYKIYTTPSRILLAIIIYFKLINFYKEEVRKDPNNIGLSNFDLFMKANGKIHENEGHHSAYCQEITEQFIYIGLIISTLFWIALYNLIF